MLNDDFKMKIIRFFPLFPPDLFVSLCYVIDSDSDSANPSICIIYMEEVDRAQCTHKHLSGEGERAV